MQVRGIFNNLLCEDILNLNTKFIEDYSYNLMNTSEGRYRTNRGGWQSDFVDGQEEVQTLIEEINKRLEYLRPVLNFREDFILKVSDLWININHPYSYNARHTHPGSYISGCYYIKVPDNSGNLILKNPTQQLMYMFYHSEDSIFDMFDETNSISWQIVPEVNKLVMFPGWIEHEVEQNLSNEDRISIAFNTAFYDKV